MTSVGKSVLGAVYILLLTLRLNAPALRESGVGAGPRTAGSSGSSARPAAGAVEQESAGE